MLGEASIHIATISHFHHIHDEFFILDFVEDPEGPLADPITRVFPGQPFAAMRSRILGECLNPFDDTLARLLLADRFDLFGRRALDDELIACHCASIS